MTDSTTKRGKLINIEGPGGSGKSTIGKMIGDIIQYKNGQETKVFTNWFKATEYGKHILSFLQTNEGLNINNLSYALLVLSVRRQFIEEIAYPLTQSGVHVIVENFFDALHVSIATRGPLSEFMHMVHRSETMEGLNIRPDLTVYMNLELTSGERFNEYNDDSYPDPWDTLGMGYGADTLQAWSTHIAQVKSDIAHETNNKLIELLATNSAEDHRAVLTNAALHIAQDKISSL